MKSIVCETTAVNMTHLLRGNTVDQASKQLFIGHSLKKKFHKNENVHFI